jgi:hypothetical protein
MRAWSDLAVAARWWLLSVWVLVGAAVIVRLIEGDKWAPLALGVAVAAFLAWVHALRASPNH